MNKFHICLSETERTRVSMSCDVIIDCAVDSIVLSAASNASPISSPGNSLGKTAVILLPLVMTEGDVALQKKLSSMIVPMTTSLLVPIETSSGF